MSPGNRGQTELSHSGSLRIGCLLLIAVGLTMPTTASANKPHSMLFKFNRHGLYGPITSKGTLYPASEKPAGLVGRSVLAVIDDPSAGEWILRLGFDESKLPGSARPAAVRVVRYSLTGWVDVQARLHKNAGGKHSLFVPLASKESVFAVVLGARSEPPPLDDMVLRELQRFRAWLVLESGIDVRGSFREQDLTAIGKVLGIDTSALKIVRSQPGSKASAVAHGILKFFDREPPDFPLALTFDDTMYLFTKQLFAANVTRAMIIRTLAAGAWQVSRWRRAQTTYLRDWSEQLVRYRLDQIPLDKTTREKAALAVQKIVGSAAR